MKLAIFALFSLAILLFGCIGGEKAKETQPGKTNEVQNNDAGVAGDAVLPPDITEDAGLDDIMQEIDDVEQVQ